MKFKAVLVVVLVALALIIGGNFYELYKINKEITIYVITVTVISSLLLVRLAYCPVKKKI